MRETDIKTGAAIRWLRSLAGMSLEALAAAAGVSASHLSRVERGEFEPRPRWVGQVTTVIAEQLTRCRPHDNQIGGMNP